jgi:putative oxidoreductase
MVGLAGRTAGEWLAMEDVALLVARLCMGVPFIIWGFGKLRNRGAELIPGLRALGIPDPAAFAFLVGACEFLGGLAVLIGYPLRTASVLLGLWCLLTGYDAHRGNQTELFKNITMAGGYFALAVAGAGALSLWGGSAPGILGWLP